MIGDGLDGLPPAEICRQYLRDHGAGHLADLIGTNKAGHPMRPDVAVTEAGGPELIADAFAICHGRDPFEERWTTMRADLAEPLPARVRLVDGVESDGNHWDPVAGDWADEYRPEAWANVSPEIWERFE